MLQPEVQHLWEPMWPRPHQLRLRKLWLRFQKKDMEMLLVWLQFQVKEGCLQWQFMDHQRHQEWPLKLRLQLLLQETLPLEKEQLDLVRPIEHLWDLRRRFVWHAKGVDCWMRRWTCDFSDWLEAVSSDWLGRLLQSHLRLQLLLLQIPEVLVMGPKSIQAWVRTQVDLVLQLVQVFAVWLKMEVWPCLIQVEIFWFWSLLVVLIQWFRMLLGSLDPVTLEFMPVWSFRQLNVRPISSWRALLRDLPVARIHRNWFRYTFLFPVLGVALCWTYPGKTGNLLRMHISGFLIIARDMFHISRAWAMCVVLWLWSFRKRTVFGQTRDWRSFWLTTTCKSLRIVLHVPWVWKLVRDNLLVKSFALHVRIRYLPQVLKRDFSVSVLRTTLHWIRSITRWRKDTHISLPDSIVVPLHFVGLINRKKHRDFVCHWLQFAFHVSSLTSGKHSFLFQLNRSVEFACLHGSQRVQGHSIVRHSFQWRLH